MAPQKRSNNLIIVLGLVTAVLGGGLVLLLMSRGGDEKPGASGAGDSVPVLVSKRAITPGTPGAELADAVEVKQVAAASRQPDAIVSVGELAERTAKIDIPPGQQLRSAFFRQRTARGEAIKVPDGKQAVAMTIPFTNAGGGYVGPGDRINVYALVARQNGSVVPLCQDQEEKNVCGGAGDSRSAQASSQLVLTNIEVLDVSQEVAPATVTNPQPAAAQPPPAGQPAAARGLGAQLTLTYLVAVDASQAEKAIFFSRYGEVYLTLVPKGQPDATTSGRDQTNALRP